MSELSYLNYFLSCAKYKHNKFLIKNQLKRLYDDQELSFNCKLLKTAHPILDYIKVRDINDLITEDKIFKQVIEILIDQHQYTGSELYHHITTKNNANEEVVYVIDIAKGAFPNQGVKGLYVEVPEKILESILLDHRSLFGLNY